MQQNYHTLPWPTLYALILAYERSGYPLNKLELSKPVLDKYFAQRGGAVCALLKKDFVGR